MRLLSVESRTLHWFTDDEVPAYAILSHTWEQEEVTYEDLRSGTAEGMKGWGKLVGTCVLAAADGYEYVWIDSCCIDKSSSAELSEAINSMFRWYEDAATCYAYLQDVACDSSNKDELLGSFRQSRWFWRGWTLQELIASPEVRFYNNAWESLGTRTELVSMISSITSIDSDVLLFRPEQRTLQDLLRGKSVAKRMSWASKRRTTRAEDAAYCLFGLFDVNMPLLYGEGLEKAFYRLQMQILSDTADLSILAWDKVNMHPGRQRLSVIAQYPRQFATCGNIALDVSTEQSVEVRNRGLVLRMQMIPESGAAGAPFLGLLPCHREDDFTNALAIPLEPVFLPGTPPWEDRNLHIATIRAGEVLSRIHDSPVRGVAAASASSIPWASVELATKRAVLPAQVLPEHVILENLDPYFTVYHTIAEPGTQWDHMTRTMGFRDTLTEHMKGAVAFEVAHKGPQREHFSFGVAFGLCWRGRSLQPFVYLVHAPHPANDLQVSDTSWVEALVSDASNAL